MLKHNLIQIYRSFKRFRGTFLINLIGLTSGLACALLIYLWVSDELSFDKFHRNESRLYQVMERQETAGEARVKFRTSGLVAETLKDELPEVEFSSSVITSSWFPKFILSPDGISKIKATGQFAGQDYFNVFSFDLVHGNASDVLAKKNSIVISDELALRLFKRKGDITGNTITLQLLHIKKDLTVTGVFKRLPPNTSEQFDFVLAFDWFKEISPAVLDWGNDGTNSYLVVKEGTDVKLLNKKIAGLVASRLPGSNRELFLKKYSENYLYGHYENGNEAGGRIEYVKLFSIIAVFILLIACINFMNLSTARASARIKEVGIKKAMGANKRMLIGQYIGESLMMAFLSLVLSIGIVQLILPHFNVLTGKRLGFELSPGSMFFLLSITLITGLIAGSYPALYLSGSNPAVVLKGKLSTATGEVFVRKGLVIFQFAISVILISSVTIVYRQIEFIQSKDPGFKKDNILYFEKEGNLVEKSEAFLAELKNIPGVEGASAMWGNLAGGYSTTGDIRWEGKRPEDQTTFEIMGVDHELMEMLGIEMTKGRTFSREFPSDSSRIIFNEAAIDFMGIKDPVGKKVSLWGQELEIAGVAGNFHFQSLHETIKPLFIRLQPENTTLIIARLKPGMEEETIAYIGRLFKTYNPGFIFDFGFLDQDYQDLHASEKRIGILSGYFAALAIVISCLGLFGLAAFTAERRVKEIGIRKVLGSSEIAIVILLCGEFTKTVLISIGIALPVGFFIAREWLDDFAYKTDLTLWYFVLAGLASLLIAWATVGTQAVRASRINPVKTLRSE